MSRGERRRWKGRQVVVGGMLRRGHGPRLAVVECGALLCSKRLQSSPRRILDWPSDPVCSTLKARAIIGSWCGKGKSLLACSCKVRGAVSDFSHSGALKGPAMRPCWTSVAISFAIISQCGSVWLRWTFSILPVVDS